MKIKLVKMVKYEDYKDKCKDFTSLSIKYNDTSLYKIADELVKTCIARNMYYFDGSYHQNGEFGSFVFEDEDGERYIYLVSMRYFGELMADVWSIIDKKTSYSYIDFYMGIHEDNDPKFHVPKSENEFLDKMSDNYSVSCERCGKNVTWDEYVINFGLCEKCMDDSYRKYLEEVEKMEHTEENEKP